ncbi:MAG: PilZ domain-containing protein [Elusimicrobiota bacterium]|nr:PilZ domain-containing protein [Elusimicrobiota bacterium]
MAGKIYRKHNRNAHDSVLEAFEEYGKRLIWTAKLINFSTGGASFSTKRDLKKGQLIFARLRIPEQGVMQVTGKVVWIKEKTSTFVYGMKFDSIKQIRQSNLA